MIFGLILTVQGSLMIYYSETVRGIDITEIRGYSLTLEESAIYLLAEVWAGLALISGVLWLFYGLIMWRYKANFQPLKQERRKLDLKSWSALLSIILMMTPMTYPVISSTPSGSHHAPRLSAGSVSSTGQPYIAGYMDTNGSYFGGVKKTRVTVSFPDTNASVIQADNWLAGGMFVTGYDSALILIDYGFYMMITLDHDGNLYLDFGIKKTYECLVTSWFPFWPPYGLSPWTIDMFNSTLPIEGVPPSTLITLTASWDAPLPSWVSWEYTVDDATYLAGTVNVTELAPTIIPSFFVGSRNLDWSFQTPWIHYWQTYLFQFGVTSIYNIGYGGWNVLLSNPSYFIVGKWHNIETAKSIGSRNALLDARWMWGGENYEGVNAYYYPFLEPKNVKFYYSDSTIEDHTILWR
jgi:hypothetical protein